MPFDKIFVDRLVQVIDFEGRGEEEPKPLADLREDRRSVVLLGDPGMGKTTALRTIADLLPGTRYSPVRTFIVNKASQGPIGSTLLLDALDEAMAAGATDPLGAVAARLHELDSPRFWLSCRAVDWVGTGGSGLLRDCARTGLIVARLLPLSDTQVAALADAKGVPGVDLMRAMRDAGMVPLLRNPWTLNLILDVAGQGSLPRSRWELLQRAAELLTSERRDRPRAGLAPPREQ